MKKSYFPKYIKSSYSSITAVKKNNNNKQAVELKKNKIGRGSQQTFFQRTHTICQQAHEKMFDITKHQGNANQNHKEVSPYTCQDCHYQKDN